MQEIISFCYNSYLLDFVGDTVGDTVRDTVGSLICRPVV